MSGRTFTREFKLEVVRQLASGAKRPAQVCREQQLAESVLSRWRREYAERGEAAFTPRSGAGVAQEWMRARRRWRRGLRSWSASAGSWRWKMPR